MSAQPVEPEGRVRVVSPPRDELSRLITPLNCGERAVFDLFDAHLPPDWEIYIQPYLNGLRPDFVLLHPTLGVAVFEVKDWNLFACDWRTEQRSNQFVLVGTDQRGHRFEKPHPALRIAQYRDEIAQIYCPGLDDRAGLRCVTAGLIVPRSPQHDVEERLGAATIASNADRFLHGVKFLGRELLDSGANARAIVPDNPSPPGDFTPDLARELRHWLVEPDFAAERRTRPNLSREQRTFVSTRTESGYRRLRGPAGSGKTLVVGGRAATLEREGKNVLVVSYNITLLNYLRNCTARFGSNINRITWLHFHAWCKRVLHEAGLLYEYRALPWVESGSRVLDHDLPELVGRALREGKDHPRYDGILVDEGQDFRPLWWEALRLALADGGEMLLVADRAQDLYQRNGLWTEQTMEGAGFRGPWATLPASYRMPARLVELTGQFVRSFFPGSDVDIPTLPEQLELDVTPTTLRWIDTDAEALAETSFDALRASVAETGSGSDEPSVFADVVFLCGTKELGRAVVSELDGRGIKTVHTFASSRNAERRQKFFFFNGDGRVKATTVHSFKGWEGRHLVVAAGEAGTQRALATVYTALTRLKAHPSGSRLTVVSAAPELRAFGKSWPVYEDRRVRRD
jgi:hypothetical protein